MTKDEELQVYELVKETLPDADHETIMQVFYLITSRFIFVSNH